MSEREVDLNKRQKFERELAHLINRFCKENESETPDFILAQYLVNCLDAFTLCSTKREEWYGVTVNIGNATKLREALNTINK